MDPTDTTHHRLSIDRYSRWLRELRARDPAVHTELIQRHTSSRPQPAGEVLNESSDAELLASEGLSLETLVRDGRPALETQQNRIVFSGPVPDSASVEVIHRLKQAAARIEPHLHLVGRIDVENFPGSATYLGTGWLVAPNIVVTNRHVASIVARADGGRYRFIPGRFGNDLTLTLDYLREKGSTTRAPAPVLRVIWIEPDGRKADFALLEVGLATDGVERNFIPLAKSDAAPGSDVVVVGYPARAAADLVPDQAWMDRIYKGFYDVKRVAPGLMGESSKGWATHDCTTLGGNSGSAVLDMNSGEAVALHFAGAYMIENYAVPASQIRRYLDKQPWREAVAINTSTAGDASVAADGRHTVSVTIPVTLTISVGDPVVNSARVLSVPDGASTPVGASMPVGASVTEEPIDVAARELRIALTDPAIVAVRAGYLVRDGTLSDDAALVVLARPRQVSLVCGRVPSTYKGFPLTVRQASVFEQLPDVLEAAVTSIAYNDADRSGRAFSFDWVDEEMEVLLHVGPERSWTVLAEFFAGTQRELVSSMYEFHADHIARAVQDKLHDGTTMTLVLAPQSRDPKSEIIPPGDFDRGDTFKAWQNHFRFELVHVPIGAAGLVAMSYHIKVSVRDRESVWLSSGNWKRTSQPLIADADLNDPRATSRAGNREWHVVLRNKTLAERYRNHILADFEAALELGGTPEAATEILVDVPTADFESVELEAAASRILEPLPVKRRVRVKPLLTPDRKGRIYTDAVLELIESATDQLVFENQYIMMRGAGAGNMKALVDALVMKARRLRDFRMILRSESDTFWDDMTSLKRRGVDVARCVRRLPRIHTKGIVVDGKRVLLGSHNWSSLGVSLNRDASLIFDDEEIAEYYLEAFEIDWERATRLSFESAISPERARLAEGDGPPPGFQRVTLASYLEG